MDYLPIQASSVPSERVFSSSAETDTKKRNRIHPVLMEALQMLKFALKQERLSFTDNWITPEAEMTERTAEIANDPLASLLRVADGNVEDVMDNIIQIIQDVDEDDNDV